jgi:hypothetical protein
MMDPDTISEPTGEDIPVHQSLSRWVVDPRDEHRPRSDPRANRAFFEAHETELAERYPDEFVAVVDGRFVDHGPNLFELGHRVFESTGCRTMFLWFTGNHRPRFTAGGNQVWP